MSIAHKYWHVLKSDLRPFSHPRLQHIKWVRLHRYGAVFAVVKYSSGFFLRGVLSYIIYKVSLMLVTCIECLFKHWKILPSVEHSGTPCMSLVAPQTKAWLENLQGDLRFLPPFTFMSFACINECRRGTMSTSAFKHSHTSLQNRVFNEPTVSAAPDEDRCVSLCV